MRVDWPSAPAGVFARKGFVRSAVLFGAANESSHLNWPQCPPSASPDHFQPHIRFSGLSREEYGQFRRSMQQRNRLEALGFIQRPDFNPNSEVPPGMDPDDYVPPLMLANIHEFPEAFTAITRHPRFKPNSPQSGFLPLTLALGRDIPTPPPGNDTLDGTMNIIRHRNFDPNVTDPTKGYAPFFEALRMKRLPAAQALLKHAAARHGEAADRLFAALVTALEKNPKASAADIINGALQDNIGFFLTERAPETQRALQFMLKTLDEELFRSGRSPSEAELFLLLRRPAGQPDILPDLTKALTAPYDFKGKGIETVNGQVLQLWSQIGQLAHSFNFWLYDTRHLLEVPPASAGALPTRQSLFERYGFLPVVNRQNDRTYGNGFKISKRVAPGLRIDPLTLIEFRRSYLLVTHPEKGTLIIRNASPKSGRIHPDNPAAFSPRSLLDQAAYYSPKTMSEWTLKTYDPNRDPNLRPIMDPQLYKSDPNPAGAPPFITLPGKQNVGVARSPVLAMDFLMNELQAVKDDYRRWKFDVSAKDAAGFTRAHLSPGFLSVLKAAQQAARDTRINRLLKTNGPVEGPPQLGFVSPSSPIYNPLATYPMNDAHLVELTRFLANKLQDEALLNSDLGRFIAGGLKHQNAELVLLRPPTKN